MGTPSQKLTDTEPETDDVFVDWRIRRTPGDASIDATRSGGTAGTRLHAQQAETARVDPGPQPAFV